MCFVFVITSDVSGGSQFLCLSPVFMASVRESYQEHFHSILKGKEKALG